jgi:hypothetical protein
MRQVLYVSAAAAALLATTGCPPKKAKPDIDIKEVLNDDIPASSDREEVVVFKRQIVQVDMWTDEEDPEAVREDQVRAVEALVEELKEKAFRQAAERVGHSMAQNIDQAELERSIDIAAENYQNYVNDKKIFKERWNEEGDQGEYSVWFAIDKTKLRKTLVEDRAVSTVAKYKTYVELYWNVEGKDINPDVLDGITSAAEGYLSEQGYRVVDFERIRSEVKLALGADDPEDRAAADELAQIRANYELRNISKFDATKNTFSKYADLLVGITISAMELTPDDLMIVRVQAKTTLFEMGEWYEISEADGRAAVPYVAGSVDSAISAAKQATRKMLAKLHPKQEDKLKKFKAQSEVAETEPQSYEIVFQDMSGSDFNQARTTLKRYKRWKVSNTNTATKTVYVTFVGSKEDAADKALTLLEGAGLDVGAPSYSNNGRKIFFAPAD